MRTDVSALRGQFAQAGAYAKEAAAEVTTAGRQAQDSWQKLSVATLEANAANRVVKDTLKDIASGAVPQTARASDDLALAQREAAMAARQLAAAQREVKVATGEANTAMASGYAQATLMSNVLDLRLGRGMEQVISRTPILASAMEAVFPVVTAIAFYDVAKQIGDAIGKWISDTYIFTEQMKAAYAAEVDLNKHIISQRNTQAEIQKHIFEQTHSDTETAKKNLEDEQKHYKDIGDQIKANQDAQQANRQKAAQERTTPQTVDTPEGRVSLPGGGQVSTQTEAESQRLVDKAAELNADLATSKLRVQELTNSYKQAADEQSQRTRQQQQEDDRQLQERAALQMKLKNAGLGNLVSSMPGGDVTSHLKVGLGDVAQIVAKAHADLAKYLDDVDKESNKRSWAAIQQFIDDRKEAIRAAKQLQQEQTLSAQGERDSKLSDLGLKEERVKGQGALGQISPQQQIAALRSLHQQELQAERDYIAQKIKIDSADAKELQKDFNQRAKIEAKGRMQELHDQQAMLRIHQQSFQQYYQNVSNMLNQNVMSWISGYQSFGSAAKQMWNGIAESAIQNMLRMAEQQIVMSALHKTLAQKDILADARASATASFHWASKWGGPVAGAIAAALAFAGAMAFGTFEEGGVVPKTQVALVHGGERVLTGSQNKTFESILQQASGGSSQGGSFSYHDNRRISSLDGPSTARVLRRNSKQVAREFARGVRLGRMGNVG